MYKKFDFEFDYKISLFITFECIFIRSTFLMRSNFITNFVLVCYLRGVQTVSYPKFNRISPRFIALKLLLHIRFIDLH